MTTSDPVGFREIISDALAYWERRRVGFNLVLGAIVVGWVVLTWPHFRGAGGGGCCGPLAWCSPES